MEAFGKREENETALERQKEGTDTYPHCAFPLGWAYGRTPGRAEPGRGICRVGATRRMGHPWARAPSSAATEPGWGLWVLQSLPRAPKDFESQLLSWDQSLS